MADRPLLLFPTPQTAERSKKGGGPSKIQYPSHQRQEERLKPKFQQLQNAVAARRVQLQRTAAGIDPELVLVMETIGSVEDFVKAVRKIDGLEWMGEVELEEILPDEDFFDSEHPLKAMKGRLYMLWSNEQALREMLSLWKRYAENPDLEFERGYAKFRDVFRSLKDIRPWGVKDRLLETGALEAWKEDLPYYGVWDILKESQPDANKKNLLGKWLGYGLPDIDRVLECTAQRATILGFGSLSDGEAHDFLLPLPQSLGSRTDWRRLTVTLAWFSPIAPKTQRYRVADLWCEVNNNQLAPQRTNADWQAVRRGTIQHEVFEGEAAAMIGETDALNIKASCRQDARPLDRPVAYGLVVSLEVKEGLDLPIYDEIRTRIKTAIYP